MLSKLIKSPTVLFAILMAIVIQLYWLFGVEQYRTPNMFGYLILVLPGIILVFLIWKRMRGGE